MGWSEAQFSNRSGKRQKVWVKTGENGAPIVEDGRIEMRYSADEDAKVYRASPGNLDFGDGAAPAAAKKKATKPAPSPAALSFDADAWLNPEGERVVGYETPPELQGMALPPAGVVDAWTDGACTGNPGPSGYGLVIVAEDKYMEISQYIGPGTNNIAELLAIRVALEELRDAPGKVRIHTDSSYSIGVLTKNWKAKKNAELIASIRNLLREYVRAPQFVKVAGHSGIPLNERADQLAVEAVQRRS